MSTHERFIRHVCAPVILLNLRNLLTDDQMFPFYSPTFTIPVLFPPFLLSSLLLPHHYTHQHLVVELVATSVDTYIRINKLIGTCGALLVSNPHHRKCFLAFCVHYNAYSSILDPSCRVCIRNLLYLVRLPF